MLSEEKRSKIIALRAAGTGVKSVARKVGVAVQTVYNVEAQYRKAHPGEFEEMKEEFSRIFAAGIGGAFSGLGLGIGNNISKGALNAIDKNVAVKNIDKEISNTEKYVTELKDRMGNATKNKKGYATQINAAQDYINDLNLYKENLKSKNPTAEANLKTAEEYKNLSEFNPNYYDTQMKQYVRINPTENGSFNVNYFNGSYVTKTKEQVRQRFLEVENNAFLKKNLNNLMSKENGGADISTLNEGDTFIDRDTGNKINVVSRDEDGTVISIDNGKSIKKSEMSNEQAEELIKN